MSHNTHTQQRVDREQDYVKEKGREVKNEVVDKARRVKEGNVHGELPSNDRIQHALQHGEESLGRFQTSERGQQMGGQGQKVVDDLKRVLADEQSLLSQKNDGDLLQNIVRHFWALLQELRHDPALRDIFEEWQSNFTSLMGSGDFTQFFSISRDLFTSIKDTEEFMDLLSQLIDVLKSMISEKTEQIVSEGETTAVELRKRETAHERNNVVAQVKALLYSLSQNDTWRMFVYRSKNISHKAHEAGDVSAQSARQVAYRVKDSNNFCQLLDDFKHLLQRLVGERRSVEPLFDYSRKAMDDILENDELSYLMDELHILLSKIVEDPALLDDDVMQQRITNLADRADRTVDKLRANPNIVGAKEESKLISEAISNEPTSRQFMTDIKALWHDVVSERPGEALDADMMKSIRMMVIPLLLEHLNNVPLPAAHDTGKFLGRFEYSIDNMKISLPELIPEDIHLRFEMDFDAKPLELEAETKHTFLYMQASNIHVHLHDAHWTFQRLTVPKVHDTGIFDVDTTGNGMTIWMKMEVKGDEKSGLQLEMLKSDVKIAQNFQIKFRESHHNKLYEFMTHIFAGKIKRNVIEMMKEKLQLFSTYFNDQLLSLISQAKAKSGEVARVAREKKGHAAEKREHARGQFEELKLQSKEAISEYKNRPEAQETKEGAKSVAKGLVERANVVVQDRLDEQKLKIEQQKREKELEKLMSETGQPMMPYGTTTYTSSAPSTYNQQSH